MMCLRNRQRAFTLIEILIVGALIALFAGIAIFNISEMYNNNVRKAAIGEARNLATACAMAQQDLGFIPKFSYLTTPLSMITTDTDPIQLRGDFDYIGFINPNNEWPPNTTSITSRFSLRGYYAFTQSRGGINRGKGGIVKVRLPSGAQSGAQDDLSDSLVDWPADPWGNPYVLYLLKTHKPEDAGDDSPPWRFIEELSEQADFVIAVVSYGPNGVPGAVWQKKSASDLYGRGAGQPMRTVTPEMRDARLYVDQDSIVPGGPAQFTMLKPVGFIYNEADLSTVRRTRIVKGPDPTDAGAVGAWNTVFPTAGIAQGGAGVEIRGVLDQGSDDIVYVF